MTLAPTRFAKPAEDPLATATGRTTRPKERCRAMATSPVLKPTAVGTRPGVARRCTPFSLATSGCRVVRLCEPCTVIQGYSARPVLRPLVHPGGLRAEILTEGTIQTGDVTRLTRS
jgi:hypothetical protein